MIILPLESSRFPFWWTVTIPLLCQGLNTCCSCINSPTPHLKPQVLFYTTKAGVLSSPWGRSQSGHSDSCTLCDAFLCDDFMPSCSLYCFSTHGAYICSSTNYDLNPLLPNNPVLPTHWGIVCAFSVDPGLPFLSPFFPSTTAALSGTSRRLLSFSKLDNASISSHITKLAFVSRYLLLTSPFV